MNAWVLRIFISALLTICLLCLCRPLIPPIPSSSMLSGLFWCNKVDPGKLFDVVFMGDSRIYRGIDPETVEKELDEFDKPEVFNFGFSSAGLDTAFLNDGAKLLNPDAAKRIIVLGVSPSALADENMMNTHYYQEKNRPATEFWQRRFINPYLSIFDPGNPALIRNKYRKNNEGYFQEYKMNGWIASVKKPIDVWKDHWMIEQGYKKAEWSLKYQKFLIDKIAEWEKSGIQVFAFRPPAVKHFEKSENEFSDFHEKAIAAQIEAAGGEWIVVEDRYSYQTYDGNHLMKYSAQRLSAFLGNAISKCLKNTSKIHLLTTLNDFESPEMKYWQLVAMDKKNAFNGNSGHLVLPKTFSAAFVLPLDELPNNKLMIRTSCWMKSVDINVNSNSYLVISVESEGESLFWQGQKIFDHILDKSDWNRVMLSASYLNNKPGAVLKVYVWNNSKIPVSIDNFKIQIDRE